MTRTKRFVLAVACVVATVPACDSASSKTSGNLKRVLTAYLDYVAKNKKSPADEKEFTAFARKTDLEDLTALVDLQAQSYKVYWGVDTSKLPAAGNTVLVYPGDAATKGGTVGMADGTVKTMTAAEFEKAAKPSATDGSKSHEDSEEPGAGRDPVDAELTKNQLKQFVLVYHSYVDDKKSTPADAEAFSAYAETRDAADVLPKLQAKGYRFDWVSHSKLQDAGTSNIILAYPGDAARNGGIVGFADGSVQTLTAAKFNAQRKWSGQAK